MHVVNRPELHQAGATEINNSSSSLVTVYSQLGPHAALLPNDLDWRHSSAGQRLGGWF